MSGLDGNDTFWAQDGEKDSLDGGNGTDVLGDSDQGVDIVANIP